MSKYPLVSVKSPLCGREGICDEYKHVVDELIYLEISFYGVMWKLGF